MKVVILAGGLGTRLSEETVVKPKPMVLKSLSFAVDIKVTLLKNIFQIILDISQILLVIFQAIILLIIKKDLNHGKLH